ncbi:MOSC domain-containing protein [Ramlibacter sp. G-1-2-2]|uniref:MOSC domain-containing protein n=1 Tax=Ramlibacter agri TaxID=2728837 RepID=A0A848H1Y6_9BURK|nr:MOSC domain-containing protein [Ramlibacter agri]NML43682.1 MOSC domain-containing protein [Ramlibacter agri]
MQVVAISSSSSHSFSKSGSREIRLLEGLGVEGDAHCGTTVKHRSRVKRNPTQPNLRQVHLMHAELFDELSAQGLSVQPGEMGENITTRGVDLLALPVDTELSIGATAVVRVTGLRNPCHQIEDFQAGLLAAVLDRDAEGQLVRKAGVMGVVVASGVVRAGDGIRVRLPSGPHRALEPV